ncbi:envelope stress response membrane protein PspC [Vibrio breoganii]|uniref:Envelope stress response membrane protein PspC n=1 Tax=Vibrio breoganii TaxID=553239 RepID=A0AAP8SXU3_9VIBR|nr:envelope stress response membrane protein PspC [Vibrio breoganii]NMO72089.1 envelope stress response membrane protein PspC [Vibrio breoganii]NMR68634.1 envelope stress response membrane protein PspC [Vibrio breoganii]OED94061.1 phage shock protein C [Vibrio breoganii ZF-29]OEF84634.1 phage shock protein C [Vibrio breoganii 1C10]PMF69372.1 phage shock protein C [Vibrio breoganii]
MRGLYRDTHNGKLTGVCAGIAARFGIEVWVVRILFVSAALLGGGFVMVLAYFAASLMLEKQSPQIFQTRQQQFDHQMKQKPWQSGKAPKELLTVMEQDFEEMETSLRKMEAYVTSDTRKTNAAFRHL